MTVSNSSVRRVVTIPIRRARSNCAILRFQPLQNCEAGSCRDPEFPSRPALTGLSHGAQMAHPARELCRHVQCTGPQLLCDPPGTLRQGPPACLLGQHSVSRPWFRCVGRWSVGYHRSLWVGNVPPTLPQTRPQHISNHSLKCSVADS